jgi:hypothetical protein
LAVSANSAHGASTSAVQRLPFYHFGLEGYMGNKTCFTTSTLGAVLLLGAALMASAPAAAQQPQIPTLQVCNGSVVSGFGLVKLSNRFDGTHAGIFHIRLRVGCEVPGYPAGLAELKIDMSDSQIQGLVTSTSIDQLTTTGRDTPTAYLNGRCEASDVKGCRFWLMLANNGAEQDAVGFLILDGQGRRVAYGTGQLSSGSINIAPTPN